MERPTPNDSGENNSRPDILGVSRNVFYLGVVSLLADISSEMVYPFIPLFLISTLGATTVPVGFIEGLAESTASLSTMVSGWLSDRLGRRKAVVLAGYGVGVFSRPLIALAGTWPVVAGLRFFDRVGKGIRTSPRDALIADSEPPALRGRAFGLHRTMDTVGAILGPGAAFLVLLAAGKANYRVLFVAAGVPALLAAAVLFFGVRELIVKHDDGVPRLRLRAFKGRFRKFVIIAAIFALVNSSNVFLILRAKALGFSDYGVAALYTLFNVTYAAAATPAGILSDRVGRRQVVVLGYLSFALVYAGFAQAQSAWMMWLLFFFYGAYPGLTEGVQRAYAADLAPAELRATGLGGYHFLVGLAAFPASLVGGLLWEYVSPAATFWYGTAGALLAAVLLLIFLPAKEVANE